MSQLGATGMAAVEDQEAYDEILERILSVLTPEEVMRHYKPEERLAGLTAEERLAGLTPEERLTGLTAEERAALRKYLHETSS
jgi:predicted nucleotidyltransferase